MTSPPDGNEYQRPNRFDDDPNVIEWKPSGVITSMWVALAIMLGGLALFLFGLVFVLVGASPEGDTLSFNPLIVVLLSVSILIIHQLLHASVARLLRGNPRIELDVVQLIFPVMYVRVTGQYFTRFQFMLYALTPIFLPSLIGILIMVIDARGAMLIPPLAINAGMSMRDLWMAWVVYRQPTGSLIQARENGLLIIRASW